MPSNCLNCNGEIQPGYQYCPNCSMPVKMHRISAGHLLHEGIHFVTHADKGIFYLIKMLVLNPGKVARDFIDGKRKKVFSPVNFFLIVVAIAVFFLSAFLQPISSERSLKMRESAARIENPGAREKMLSTIGRMEKSEAFTSRYSNLVTMLATPLAAVLFWLFYRRARFNYLEHLVANMYFVGFSVLIYAVVFVPLKTLFSSGFSQWLFLGSYFLFEISYRAFAYYHFIENYSVRGKLRAVMSSTIVVLVWVALSYFAIYHYIRSGWWGLAA